MPAARIGASACGVAAMHGQPGAGRDLQPVVVDDVGHAGERHVVLQANRVGDALADDSVAVDGYPDPVHVHSFDGESPVSAARARGRWRT
jgi:hypothetical protein